MSDEETRRFLHLGVQIGRSIGEIENLLRYIPATAVCTKSAYRIAEDLHSAAKKLLKETDILLYAVRKDIK